ncbi:hypothetical protein AGLY_000446 [Aphis glycines]|uniref:Uncharacterized protein n=1 Tax=Aphis glycines TaxID=307491 RepID=A0A6G0U7H5_APHGL|nr:hypothetical protein AGLY_000446 [Aphis glycines]
MYLFNLLYSSMLHYKYYKSLLNVPIGSKQIFYTFRKFEQNCSLNYQFMQFFIKLTMHTILHCNSFCLDPTNLLLKFEPFQFHSFNMQYAYIHYYSFDIFLNFNTVYSTCGPNNFSVQLYLSITLIIICFSKVLVANPLKEIRQIEVPICFSTFQSLCLRQITGALWYMTNDALHKDLQILTVNEIATYHYKKFHSKLHSNQNPLISRMSSITIPNNPPRRLKRKWPRDALT